MQFYVLQGRDRMSVEIYGVDNHSERFRSIGVSCEDTFHRIWEVAIKELNLHLIGNGVWLYKKDLDAILVEFDKVREYVKENEKISEVDKQNVFYHVENILGNLEANWNEIETAERLWMG